MNLAIVVTPEQPVPPPAYGGAERCTDVMVCQLIKMGHKVDLYCGPESSCPATNKIMSPNFFMREESYLLSRLYGRREKYHCIIDYAAFHLAGQHLPNVVSLMGGDPYKRYPHDKVRNRVYKSKEFASFYGCPNHPVVTNLIELNPSKVPLKQGSLNYALYVGNILPMKGVHIAAEACEIAEIPFHVVGPIKDGQYFRGFEKKVRYCGVIGEGNIPGARDMIFGDAAVFLHPVQCCDCDPLAPKEAMLRGTPVVACPRGGLLSSVSAGVSGYFANTPDEFAEAIKKCQNLDRALIRDRMIRMIDPEWNMRILINLCERVAKGESW